MESWYNNRKIEMSHGQPIQPLYYKHENEIGNIPEMVPEALWWRETCTTPINTQQSLEEKDENIDSCSLLDNSMEATESRMLQSSDESSKKFIKNKRTKVSKQMADRKRIKNPDNWKVNIKKNARLRGEEYVGVGGKIVPAKVMGPPCDCRMRCSIKVEETAREELHNVFWKTCTWEQRKQYIALSVKESPKQRSRCRSNVRSEHRRQVTFTYSLLLSGEFVTVCKSMFLSTFSISEKFVRHVMDKKRMSPGGIIGPDLRGRHTPKTKKSEAVRDRVRQHIQSFPAEKSENSRDHSGRKYLNAALNIAAMHKLYMMKCKENGVPDSDIVKESYYREMFKTEFNLGFKTSKDKDKKQPQIEPSVDIKDIVKSDIE